jgi:mono/diheme cytochrome c family protein
LVRLLAAALVATGVAGCAGSTTDSTAGDSGQESARIAVGETLYASFCASCHGTDLRGTNRGPSHLSQVYEPDHHADAAFLLAVRLGVTAHHWSFGPMPPIEGLSDDDVAAIAAFVRAVQDREGFEPYPP